MSFLDNLENNLKALEAREQSVDDSKRRDMDRTHAVTTGPWAEKLKKGPYASAIMQTATRAGFKIRTKVNLIWIGSTLRLEARGHCLELRPTANGVVAVFLHRTDEIGREEVDLNGSPEALVKRWMLVLEEQKKADDAAAAREAEQLAQLE